MSNLLFNIRFGTHHWQLDRDWHMRWAENLAHAPEVRPFGWKWFAVYCAFGKHFE